MARTKWRDRHWDARLAHDRVGRAIDRGVLTPEVCEVCGGSDVVAHHDDYSQALAVRWLCHSHHRLWHLANPVDYEVLAPPPKAKPTIERKPNRGKRFRQYLVPRALALRRHGASYAEISKFLGVSVSTAHTWCKEYAHGHVQPDE